MSKTKIQLNFLYDKAQTPYHFHHFWIIEVIDDVFQDVSVSHKAQSSENDHNWDLLFHVWQDTDDTLTNG